MPGGRAVPDGRLSPACKGTPVITGICKAPVWSTPSTLMGFPVRCAASRSASITVLPLAKTTSGPLGPTITVPGALSLVPVLTRLAGAVGVGAGVGAGSGVGAGVGSIGVTVVSPGGATASPGGTGWGVGAGVGVGVMGVRSITCGCCWLMTVMLLVMLGRRSAMTVTGFCPFSMACVPTCPICCVAVVIWRRVSAGTRSIRA